MLLHRTIEGEGLTRSGEQDELSMETAAAVMELRHQDQGMC